MSVQPTTQFSASRTLFANFYHSSSSTGFTKILCFAVVAFSYAILLIDAVPTIVDIPNNATIEVPIAAINTSQNMSQNTSPNTPELFELQTTAEYFSLKINFPLLRALNSTINDAIKNATAAADDPEVIVRGAVSVDIMDILQRVVVKFEADRHGNSVKFHLEPAFSVDPKLGAATLKNTVG